MKYSVRLFANKCWRHLVYQMAKTSNQKCNVYAFEMPLPEFWSGSILSLNKSSLATTCL